MVNHKQEKASFARVSWLDVDEHQQGQRIDNFLFKLLKGVPKSRIYRILRKGELRVNKARVRPEYKLQAGDRLRIPPIRTAETETQSFNVPGWVKAAIENPIYLDEALVAINKPPGLAVHGGSGIEFGLIEAMRQLRPEWPFLELVHRIDRETSGCLLLARSRSVLNSLHQQFRREQGKLEKSYLALLGGRLESVTRVTRPLQQYRDQAGLKRVRVDQQGQPAKSTFMPVECFTRFSYVRILLHTGRMHQARVHAASLDMPILGDSLYGERELNRSVRALGVRRCMLHAERYQLEHPLSGRMLQIQAPLPDDFTEVLKRLEP